MPELLQQSISGNELMVFAVALFFSAISGQKMEPGQRVALVYSYCLIVAFFGYVDYCSIAFGSLIVFFLIFEVFSNDKTLVHLFSFKYNCLDFLYRLLLEYHGAFFYAALFFSSTASTDRSLFAQIVFLILAISLAAATSRRHFATKRVSYVIDKLEALAGYPASCSFTDKDRSKLEILIYMEDGTFPSRDEHTHIVTARYVASRIALRLKRSGFASIRNGLANIASLRRLIRGYGTIEMQIMRNIGLHFGSYRLTIRRKLFELLFSQAVFNSYIDQLSKGSPARDNIKEWILGCYVNLVSVKIDSVVCHPKIKESTFNQLFKKEFSELTEEEFFVWCLGLPHYKNGVGERAVRIHIDAVERFGLCEESINSTIAKLKKSRSA